MESNAHPGSPGAVVEETVQAAGGDGVAKSTRKPLNLINRRKVVKQKNKGLRAYMGANFEGGIIKIRPWGTWFIQKARATYAEELRTPEMKKGDDLPPVEALELNRYTALLAVTGMEMDFVVDEQGAVVTFDQTSDPGELREFLAEYFLPPVDLNDPETANLIDQDFLKLIMNLESKLDGVPFQEIERLGKNFVFGDVSQLDYSD